MIFNRMFLLFLLLVPLASIAKPPYENIIIFGDSLSDATSFNPALNNPHGNNYWGDNNGVVGAPITSINQATGQRAMWPNYFVKKYSGLILAKENSMITPSSQITVNGASPHTQNINYAWASAETGEDYVNYTNWPLKKGFPDYNNEACKKHGPGVIAKENSCIPGVITQVKLYLKAVNNHPNKNSLIIIWAGGNDIFNNLGRIADKTKGSNKYIILLKMLNATYPFFEVGEVKLANPIHNLKVAIKMLAIAGVPLKNIYIIDLPNLANTPNGQSVTKGSKAALTALTAISNVFNSMLRLNLVYNPLYSAYNLSSKNIISTTKLLEVILNDPLQYGFTNTLDSCVHNRKDPYCEGYLFFNNKHPSSQAHELIADYIASVVNKQ